MTIKTESLNDITNKKNAATGNHPNKENTATGNLVVGEKPSKKKTATNNPSMTTKNAVTNNPSMTSNKDTSSDKKPSFWNTLRGLGVMCLVLLFAGFLTAGMCKQRMMEAAEVCAGDLHCFTNYVCPDEKCIDAVLTANSDTEHRITDAAKTCVGKEYVCFLNKVCTTEMCKKAILEIEEDHGGPVTLLHYFDTKLDAIAESLTKMEAFGEPSVKKMEALVEAFLTTASAEMLQKMESFRASLLATANVHEAEISKKMEQDRKAEEPLFAALEAFLEYKTGATKIATNEKTTIRNEEVEQELQDEEF